MLTAAQKRTGEDARAMVAASFAQYQAPIFAYLVGLVGERKWAEELGLETFRAALRASDDLPAIPGQRAWFYRIATSNAFRALKRRHLTAWLPRRGAIETPGDNAETGRSLARSEAAEQGLAALAPEQRAPLLLYSHHDLNITEIAQALGICEAAASTRLYRARVLFLQAKGPEVQELPGHPEIREALAAYDKLSREEQIELNAHLTGCAECTKVLATYRRIDRALRHLPDPPPARQLEAAVRIALAHEQGPSRTPTEPGQRVPPAEPLHPTTSEPELTANAVLKPEAKRNWQRLLLPLAMALLFVASLAFGTRGREQPGRNRIEIGPTVPVATDMMENRVLPLPPAEALSTIDAQRPVTVTFACDDPQEISGNYRSLVEAFQSQNPKITIRLMTEQEALGAGQGGSNERQSRIYLDTTRALALRADIFCAHASPDLLQEGLVRNLMPLATADEEFGIEQFYPAILKQVTNAGALYLVPARFRPTVIRYDPGAFEAAGIHPPRPGWSWDDLLNAAIALRSWDASNTRRWGFGESDDTLFRARFLSAVTSWQSPTSTARSDAFDAGQLLDLFRWYDQLYLETKAALIPRGLAGPGTAEPSFPSFQTQVAQGAFAMWTDDLAPTPRQGIRAAPFPVTRAFDKTTPVGEIDGWAISAGAEHVDAAWRWVSFISQHLPADPQRLRVPARQSVPQMQAFWSTVAPEDRDAYAYALEHLATWPRLSQADGTLQLYTSLLAMMRGETARTEMAGQGAAPVSRTIEPPSTLTLTFAAPRGQKTEYEQAATAFNHSTASSTMHRTCPLQ